LASAFDLLLKRVDGLICCPANSIDIGGAAKWRYPSAIHAISLPFSWIDIENFQLRRTSDFPFPCSARGT
jgi:hypothetical protein